MYPTKEEFEEMLRTRNLDCILGEHLFAGLPFSFANQPEVPRQMIGEISRGLRVPREDIRVVGSARLGFSLSPYKYGEPFNRYSDLDIIVVSSSLFDPSWLDILTNRRVPWSMLRSQTRQHLKDHRENHYVYNGWIVPHFVPETLAVGEQWVTTFAGLSQIPFLSSRHITGRLYRTWEHAWLYHRWSLTRVRDKIIARQ